MSAEALDRLRHVDTALNARLFARGAELGTLGREIIALSAGEPYSRIADEATRAAVDIIQRGDIRYAGSEGTPRLKAALAEKLERENGLVFKPEQIVVANGSKPLMTGAIFAVTEPGDEVIVPSPYYTAYREIVHLAGATPVDLPCSPAEGYRLTADRLLGVIGPRTRAIFLANPNNPTGSILGLQDWRELYERVLKRHPDVHLIVDEIFEHIHFDRKPASPPAAVPELAGRTILINGFSKGYSMNGWRLGFAAGPRDLMRRLAAVALHLAGPPSPISQAAGLAALQANGKIAPEEIESYRARRDRTVRFLNEIDGLFCHVPEATFLLFPSVSGLFGRRTQDGASIRDSEDFGYALLEATGVLVSPGRVYGAREHVRISIAHDDETVERAVRLIARFVDSLQPPVVG